MQLAQSCKQSSPSTTAFVFGNSAPSFAVLNPSLFAKSVAEPVGVSFASTERKVDAIFFGRRENALWWEELEAGARGPAWLLFCDDGDALSMPFNWTEMTICESGRDARQGPARSNLIDNFNCRRSGEERASLPLP